MSDLQSDSGAAVLDVPSGKKTALMRIADQSFYVYVIFRPNGIPCYVGKGKGKRWKTTDRKHNKALQNLLDRNDGHLPITKIREGLTETEALETEIAFIAAIGRQKDGGPLYNLTDGGDGLSGWIPSEETRVRISASKIGQTHTELTKQKMSAANKGRPKTAEHRAKIGAVQVGKKMPSAAQQRLNEIRRSPEWKEAQQLRALAQHASMTDEQKAARKARISEKTREAMARPEVAGKVVAAAIENHLRRERASDGKFA